MGTIAIPRALERYPLGKRIEGEPERWEATDRERAGRECVVTRVRFGPEERAARDALVARARALYTVASPTLVSTYDAGVWDDDAFLVEERVIEPRSIEAWQAELDLRERALAAKAMAEGLATLHESGFCVAELDVVIDAYRQPRISVARYVRAKDEAAEAADVARLDERIALLLPDWTARPSARAAALAVQVPAATPSPLVHGRAPGGPSATLWVATFVVLALVALYLASR